MFANLYLKYKTINLVCSMAMCDWVAVKFFKKIVAFFFCETINIKR